MNKPKPATVREILKSLKIPMKIYKEVVKEIKNNYGGLYGEFKGRG